MASHQISPPSLQLLRFLRSTPVFHPSRNASPHLTRSTHHASSHRSHHRPFTTHFRLSSPPPSSPPKSTNRGPKSTEDTVTDFGTMDVLSSTPPPTTSIDACLSDGFHFDNGLKISGGSGCLLVGGEAFAWRPWAGRADGRRSMLNRKGQWDAQRSAWGLLDVVWPKPGQHEHPLPTPLLTVCVIYGVWGMVTDFSQCVRSSDPGSWTHHASPLARNAADHQCDGYPGRLARYQERGLAVQSAGYGERGGQYSCCDDPDWMEGATMKGRGSMSSVYTTLPIKPKDIKNLSQPFDSVQVRNNWRPDTKHDGNCTR